MTTYALFHHEGGCFGERKGIVRYELSELCHRLYERRRQEQCHRWIEKFIGLT